MKNRIELAKHFNELGLKVGMDALADFPNNSLDFVFIIVSRQNYYHSKLGTVGVKEPSFWWIKPLT